MTKPIMGVENAAIILNVGGLQLVRYLDGLHGDGWRIAFHPMCAPRWDMSHTDFIDFATEAFKYVKEEGYDFEIDEVQ